MPQSDLFSKQAEYTIDSCSLMAMFNDEPWTSRKHNPGLWERVLGMINEGVIVSHAEVLAEIKKDGEKGEDLFVWASANSHIFWPHDLEREGGVIRQMSLRYREFVSNYGKASHVYADPWLIAQAKCLGLKIISEETLAGSGTKKPRLPNVCADATFGVTCLDLWGLAKERDWKFR